MVEEGEWRRWRRMAADGGGWKRRAAADLKCDRINYWLDLKCDLIKDGVGDLKCDRANMSGWDLKCMQNTEKKSS